MTDQQTAASPFDRLLAALEVHADLSVKLGSSVDRLAAAEDRRNELVAQAQALTPVYAAPLYASGVADGTNPLVLDLGGPTMGHRFDIRRLAVGTVDETTADTADVYVFVTAITGSALPDALTILDLADATTSVMPAVAFYGGGDLVILPQEHLVVVIVGGTASRTYGAKATVMDLVDTATTRAVTQT